MSIEQEIYNQIKEDILDGSLGPGERLVVATLRNRYDAGTSQIREALSRLLAAGFIGLEPNKGYSVSTISPEDLQDLVETRCEMESAALRLAIRNGGDEWHERIVLAHFRLSRTQRVLPDERRINPQWEEQHTRFHHVLVAGCGLKWLTLHCDQLREFSSRYVRIAVQSGFANERASGEHETLMKACLDGDADGAVSILKNHYRSTSTYVLKVFEKRIASR